MFDDLNTMQIIAVCIAIVGIGGPITYFTLKPLWKIGRWWWGRNTNIWYYIPSVNEVKNTHIDIYRNSSNYSNGRCCGYEDIVGWHPASRFIHETMK